MAAYYLKSWQLWATYDMRRFEVEYANGSGHRQQASLTELLAVRIRFFGNILRELVPGASLDRADLRAVMCLKVARLFGGSPDVWMRLRATYDLKKSEQNKKVMARVARIVPIKLPVEARA